MHLQILLNLAPMDSKGPTIFLLTPLTRSAALHFATLTRSIHGLSDTLHSLLWTIEIHENVITL